MTIETATYISQLDATALEAARHIRDTEEVSRLAGYVTAALDSVRRASERKGQPSNGSMQIKVRR